MAMLFATNWTLINSSTPTFTSEIYIPAGMRICVQYKAGLSFVSGATASLASCTMALYRKPPGDEIFHKVDAQWSVADSEGEKAAHEMPTSAYTKGDEIEGTVIKVGHNAGMDMFIDRLGIASTSYSSGAVWVRVGGGY